MEIMYSGFKWKSGSQDLSSWAVELDVKKSKKGTRRETKLKFDVWRDNATRNTLSFKEVER